MGVRRAPSPPPDRLAAVLGELDRARTTPGWLPEEEAVTDRRPPRVRRIRGRSKPTDDASEPRHLRVGEDPAVRPHTPLVRTPSSLEGAVIAPSRLALVAVLVLLVAAGVVLGGRLLWVRATAAPRPVSTAPLAAATDEAPSSLATRSNPAALGAAGGASSAGRATSPGAVAAAPGGASSAGPLVVDVVGQVTRPGVVRLPPGSRVEDAVKAAGGAARGADVARINLARPVVDGEQIRVPKPGEELPDGQPPAAAGSPAGSTGAAGSGGAPGAAAGGATTGAPVNLNTADLAALDGLPGIGPVIAQRILQWRNDNGRFTTVDELGEVSGIGEKMLAQIRPRVTV